MAAPLVKQLWMMSCTHTEANKFRYERMRYILLRNRKGWSFTSFKLLLKTGKIGGTSTNLVVNFVYKRKICICKISTYVARFNALLQH